MNKLDCSGCKWSFQMIICRECLDICQQILDSQICQFFMSEHLKHRVCNFHLHQSTNLKSQSHAQKFDRFSTKKLSTDKQQKSNICILLYVEKKLATNILQKWAFIFIYPHLCNRAVSFVVFCIYLDLILAMHPYFCIIINL